MLNKLDQRILYIDLPAKFGITSFNNVFNLCLYLVTRIDR